MRQLVILVDETQRCTALALSRLLALFVPGSAARNVEHGRRGGGQRMFVVRLSPAARLGGLFGHSTAPATAASTSPGATTTVRVRIGHAVVAVMIVSPVVVMLSVAVNNGAGDLVVLAAATPPSPTKTAREKKTSAVQISLSQR